MKPGVYALNWIDALPERLRRQVMHEMKSLRVGSSRLIFERYEPSKGLYRVITGKVRMFSLAPDGRELIYKVYGPTESFGEIAAIDGRPYPLSAEAVGDCELLHLSSTQLTRLRREHPEVETALLNFTVQIARSSLMFIEEATLFPLPARVASRLAFLASAVKATGESVSELKIAQKDLGVMVGASRQAVNKVLSDFQALGLIETSYGSVRIKDHKGLLYQSTRVSPPDHDAPS